MRHCGSAQGWHHNRKGVPLLICGESDGTLNISDIDVWMWLKKLSREPANQPVHETSTYQPLQQARAMEGSYQPPGVSLPQGDTSRASIMLPFPIRGHNTPTVPLGEIAKWLTQYGGLAPNRVPQVEAYVACLLSKVYNLTAIKGQQQMKKATS
jgi:hypothetical protein